ncbi:HAD-IA family hydrolase [Nostoc sp. MG11]|uniref:HAD-IA family hydrolase n=1 Tax=Nostoc sp. MG11 TaxID=2721166 RepID=UPI00186780BF|nr:HAD-IA family hydrolase [Nostoc sp. MG11]
MSDKSNLQNLLLDEVLAHYDGSSKPAPNLFLYAAENLEVNAQFCTVVEDSILGVRAGITAGMKVLGYSSQSEAIELEECGACVFHFMYQLSDLL